MAAGPLVCYLYEVLKIEIERFTIQQGKYMKEPSPSLLIVNLNIENGIIKGLMAGGKGIWSTKIEI
jgi:predicted PhzF superfamily epimerase YddE/YHI9